MGGSRKGAAQPPPILPCEAGREPVPDLIGEGPSRSDGGRGRGTWTSDFESHPLVDEFDAMNYCTKSAMSTQRCLVSKIARRQVEDFMDDRSGIAREF